MVSGKKGVVEGGGGGKDQGRPGSSHSKSRKREKKDHGKDQPIDPGRRHCLFKSENRSPLEEETAVVHFRHLGEAEPFLNKRKLDKFI